MITKQKSDAFAKNAASNRPNTRKKIEEETKKQKDIFISVCTEEE